MPATLQSPVQYLKGVGPKRAEALETLGIKTVEDLLFTAPRNYQDLSEIIPIGKTSINETQTIMGEIVSVRSKNTRKGLSILTARIQDTSGIIKAIWFNQPYLLNILREGRVVLLQGKISFGSEYEIHPLKDGLSFIDEESGLNENRDKLLPVYPLNQHNKSQGFLRKIVKTALELCGNLIEDHLPGQLRRSANQPPLQEAIHYLHFPPDQEAAKRAKKRIAFDEFLLFEIAVLAQKRVLRQERKTAPLKFGEALDKRIRKRLPFKMTQAQDKVIEDIIRDMTGKNPMNRLLQGDVGSGKTAVAIYASLLTVANKRQVAFMAPTEILAEQHAFLTGSLLADSDVKIACLTGGTKTKRREDIQASLLDGSLNILFGTHALFEDKVRFKNLGLAIIDEQHRFGVSQRAKLIEKAERPDILVMTATPIPRTLALTVFGDMDTSLIKELPPGRQAITTAVIRTGQKKSALSNIEMRLKEYRQAYFVCPLIADSEKLDLKAAVNLFEEITVRFPEFRVGLLHGRLPSKEKESVMRSFKSQSLDILVSTTVIEVGVDVPNATVMWIENAERFGLSQLHQLRGRVGRGEHPSFCYLVTETENEDSLNRLSVLEHTSDGFVIAEEDLKIRGPGEFFGTRQHGLPEFQSASLVEDLDSLLLARDEAEKVLQVDPKLQRPENQLLKDALIRRYKGRFKLFQV